MHVFCSLTAITSEPLVVELRPKFNGQFAYAGFNTQDELELSPSPKPGKYSY